MSSSTWMTKAEAAAHLRVNRHTIDRYVREGLLPKFYLAGVKTPRFKRSDLDALARPVEPNGDASEDEDNPDAA